MRKGKVHCNVIIIMIYELRLVVENSRLYNILICSRPTVGFKPTDRSLALGGSSGPVCRPQHGATVLYGAKSHRRPKTAARSTPYPHTTYLLHGAMPT